MAIRRLETPPQTTDFTPLQEHQEQTPSTFFGAKPVLYVQQSRLTLSAPASQVEQDAAFSKFSSLKEGDDILIKDVEIFVSSDNLTFFQQAPSPTGVSIPYPSIGLHATMKYKETTEALYMSLSLNDVETVNEDEDIRVLELTVLPPSYESSPEAACIKEIFTAMNTCADLHPDPDASGEDGEDILDETAPGATGWITAENMDDFLDENGNFKGTIIGDEELGPGAGTVRQRDDTEDANDTNGVDGHEEKYHRTG